MKLRIRPLGDRIWVKKVEAEEKIGSIHIPELFKDQPQVGKVVAVGPGPLTEWPEGFTVEVGMPTVPSYPSYTVRVQRQPCSVRAGDTILFGKYSGASVPVVMNETKHEVFLLREEEVLAILEEVEHPKDDEPTL
jgi:chaperonin GroES